MKYLLLEPWSLRGNEGDAEGLRVYEICKLRVDHSLPYIFPFLMTYDTNPEQAELLEDAR